MKILFLRAAPYAERTRRPFSVDALSSRRHVYPTGHTTRITTVKYTIRCHAWQLRYFRRSPLRCTESGETHIRLGTITSRKQTSVVVVHSRTIGLMRWVYHFGNSTGMLPFSDAICHFTATRTIILLSLLYYLPSKYHDAQKGDEYQTIPTICKGSYEGGSGMCSR